MTGSSITGLYCANNTNLTYLNPKPPFRIILLRQFYDNSPITSKWMIRHLIDESLKHHQVITIILNALRRKPQILFIVSFVLGFLLCFSSFLYCCCFLFDFFVSVSAFLWAEVTNVLYTSNVTKAGVISSGNSLQRRGKTNDFFLL